MAFGNDWQTGLEVLCADDANKLQFACKVTTWFCSPTVLQNQARVMLAAGNCDERNRMPDLHSPSSRI